MSETQDAQIRNTIPANIAKPLSDRFVRIFRNSNDGLYYGKRFNDTIELIGGADLFGRVFVQGGDTSLGFLIDKLSAGAGVSFNVVDLGGGNLSLEISSMGSNMQTLIKSGYVMSVPAATQDVWLPIFQYTGRVLVKKVIFFNIDILSIPDANYTNSGMAVNDDLVSIANLVNLGGGVINLTPGIEGHIIRSSGLSSFTINYPIVNDNVVGINSLISEAYLDSKDSGNSYIGAYIGTNPSTTPYSATYDVLIEWEPLSTGATLVAL